MNNDNNQNVLNFLSNNTNNTPTPQKQNRNNKNKIIIYIIVGIMFILLVGLFISKFLNNSNENATNNDDSNIIQDKDIMNSDAEEDEDVKLEENEEIYSFIGSDFPKNLKKNDYVDIYFSAIDDNNIGIYGPLLKNLKVVNVDDDKVDVIILSSFNDILHYAKTVSSNYKPEMSLRKSANEDEESIAGDERIIDFIMSVVYVY